MSKIPTQYRDENFRMMDSLFYLSDQRGMGIMALYTYGDFFIEYFKPVRKEPKVEECRDRQDYELRYAHWLRESTVRSPHYKSFSELVTGEITRLKEMM